MFRNPLGPRLLPLSLRAVSGDIHAHLFENPGQSVPRNLYWGMLVEFEPVTLDGEEWDCAMLVDWLTWPVRTWLELDGMNLSTVMLPDMFEPSLYLMAEHHPATLKELRLSKVHGATFEVAVEASARVRTEKGERTIPLSFQCQSQFTGIIVVTDSLQPQPSSPALVEAAVAQFIGMDGLRNARSEGWRYVLDPQV